MSCCARPAAERLQARPPTTALIVGAILAGNSMVVALATNLNALEPYQRLAAHGALALIACINGWLLARPLLRAARQAGVRSVPGLFVLGLMGALTFSTISTVRGQGPVYYEIVSILLVVYSVGQALTALAQARVTEQLAAVTQQRDQCTIVAPDGSTCQRAVTAVTPGDQVRIKPGEVVPVDGQVIAGVAFIQAASSTGESRLRRVAPKDRVLASWFCVDATLLVRAEAPGHRRAIDTLAQDVQQARAQAPVSPAPQDRIAARFVPLVLLASAGTFAWWCWRASVDVALLNALSVALVACPCAFGFAVPIGIRTGMLRLARMGIVLRDSRAIQALARVRHIVFDKTGTLTQTTLAPERTRLLTQSPHTAGQLVGLAALAQSLVQHPIGTAFAPYVTDAPAGFFARAARLLPGRGIEVEMAGPTGPVLVQLGRPDNLVLHNAAAAADAAAALRASGADAIALSLDGQALCLFALMDGPVGSMQALGAALHRRSLGCEVLSGDSPEAVAALALIVPASGGQSARAKAQRVTALQRSGPVCFVGDGINDATAMAQADVAACMLAGTDLSLELADFVLPAQRPEAIVTAYDISCDVARVVRQNLWVSVVYNVLGITVAACGWLNPVFATLLMAASSVTVSLTTLVTLSADGARPTMRPTAAARS